MQRRSEVSEMELKEFCKNNIGKIDAIPLVQVTSYLFTKSQKYSKLTFS